MNDTWNLSSYSQYKPRILLGWYDNKLYATVSDNTTIYRFVSLPEKEKKAIIYAASASKCKLVSAPNFGNIWQIIDSEQDINLNKSALQVISCGANDSKPSTWLISNNPIGYIYDSNFDAWVKNVLWKSIPRTL